MNRTLQVKGGPMDGQQITVADGADLWWALPDGTVAPVYRLVQNDASLSFETIADSVGIYTREVLIIGRTRRDRIVWRGAYGRQD